MSRIECPHCEEDCENFSDFLYDNDLYQSEEPKEVRCSNPACNELFWINAETTVKYFTAKTEDEI